MWPGPRRTRRGWTVPSRPWPTRYAAGSSPGSAVARPRSTSWPSRSTSPCRRCRSTSPSSSRPAWSPAPGTPSAVRSTWRRPPSRSSPPGSTATDWSTNNSSGGSTPSWKGQGEEAVMTNALTVTAPEGLPFIDFTREFDAPVVGGVRGAPRPRPVPAVDDRRRLRDGPRRPRVRQRRPVALRPPRRRRRRVRLPRHVPHRARERVRDPDLRVRGPARRRLHRVDDVHRPRRRTHPARGPRRLPDPRGARRHGRPAAWSPGCRRATTSSRRCSSSAKVGCPWTGPSRSSSSPSPTSTGRSSSTATRSASTSTTTPRTSSCTSPSSRRPAPAARSCSATCRPTRRWSRAR